MKRGLLVLLMVLVAGCGVRPSGVIPGNEAPTGPASGAVLYFVSNGQPVRVLRPLARDLSPAETIALLADGPDVNEQDLRYTSEVPPSTVVLAEMPSPDVLVLTLTVHVTSLSELATDQLVCTARDVYSARQIILRGQGTERGPLACPLNG